MSVTATRYHDISTGHRVYGHESKCSHLHGHNYRVHFTVAPKDGMIDSIGRVLDFSVIKKHLCVWLENNWDHKMLIDVNDPWLHTLKLVDPDGVISVSFNPTAENMAKYLVEKIGPLLLANENAVLVSVKIEETMKCSAEYILDE
jgi:6-pyruvoyltetrahydropterin/6-carboxytetrahydropterin synthase